MIYKNLKKEMSINNITNPDSSLLDNSKKIEAADLLIYRGKKYSDNKNKLKQQFDLKEKEKCPFKPELGSKK